LANFSAIGAEPSRKLADVIAMIGDPLAKRIAKAGDQSASLVVWFANRVAWFANQAARFATLRARSGSSGPHVRQACGLFGAESTCGSPITP
jgi:hypothetical protein